MTREEEHPARPEQRESFEKGGETEPETPEEQLDPDFARGTRKGQPHGEGHFSTGEEETPDAPGEHRDGSFADGYDEDRPDSDDRDRERDD